MKCTLAHRETAGIAGVMKSEIRKKGVFIMKKSEATRNTTVRRVRMPREAREARYGQSKVTSEELRKSNERIIKHFEDMLKADN